MQMTNFSRKCIYRHLNNSLVTWNCNDTVILRINGCCVRCACQFYIAGFRRTPCGTKAELHASIFSLCIWNPPHETSVLFLSTCFRLRTCPICIPGHWTGERPSFWEHMPPLSNPPHWFPAPAPLLCSPTLPAAPWDRLMNSIVRSISLTNEH